MKSLTTEPPAHRSDPRFTSTRPASESPSMIFSSSEGSSLNLSERSSSESGLFDVEHAWSTLKLFIPRSPNADLSAMPILPSKRSWV